jgi:hypothetical protein
MERTVGGIAALGLGDSCEFVGTRCVSVEAQRLLSFSILRRGQPLATTEVALESRNVFVSDRERDGENAAMLAAQECFRPLDADASAPFRERYPHVGPKKAAKVSSLEAADLGRAGQRERVVGVGSDVSTQPLQAPVAGDCEQITAMDFRRQRCGQHRTSGLGNINPTGVDTIPPSDGTQ